MTGEEQLTKALSDQAVVDASTLARARDISRAQGAHILHTLFDLGAISADVRAQLAAQTLGLDRVSGTGLPPAPVMPDKLPLGFLERIGALPIADDGTALTVAMVDPFHSETHETLRVASRRQIVPMVIDAETLATGHAQLYRDAPEVTGGGQVMPAALDLGDNMEEAARQAPVIRLVKALIDKAIRSRASDIHVEPFADRLALRYRIDGVLVDQPSPEPGLATAITSRLKIMARLNITERRLPQDGRFSHVCDGRSVDVRMSTVPTLAGESVVLRLLDQDRALVSFDDLGMRADEADQLARLLAQPNGIILLTGPTGSGKTTTLYAALRQLNAVERKILSIEDPVEYQLSGVNQIAVKSDIGLTFASLLRSALRQDPDVIMVGEMRDAETAEIGSRAALTGHLVLSTVHTNTALGAVTRLRDMGIPDYVLSASLSAVIAQRLVRRLCTSCAQTRPLTPDEAALFRANDRPVGKADQVGVACGCDACNGTGYNGRMALYEVLEITGELRQAIAAGDSEAALTTVRRPGGTLVANGLEQVANQQTTLEELARVIGLVVGNGRV